MKRFFSLLIICLLIGIFFSTNDFVMSKNDNGNGQEKKDKISKEEIAKKFDKSNKKIKDKYQMEKAAIVKPAKDKNGVKVEMGDKTKDKFTPELHINKWDDEIKFKIKPKDLLELDTDLAEDLVFDDKIIKYKKNSDIEYHYYDIEPNTEHPDGAYEFEVILNSLPDSNVITLDIETDNLDFFYQPALNTIVNPLADHCTETQCFDVDNNIVEERPENVVGSYAVYHSSKKGDYSYLGGKKYTTGKAFHIYRPKIIDDNNNWVWGKLNINTDKGELSVTIDQAWLNNAVYPVIVDPTFGFTSIGGSMASYNNFIMGSQYISTGAGTLTDLHFYGDSGGSSSGTAKIVIYNSSNNLVDYTAELTLPSFSAPAWVTATLNSGSESITDATLYKIGIWSGGFRLYYDSAVAGFYYSSTYSDTTPPNPFSPSNWNNHKISVYATYSEASTTNRRIIMAE